VSGMSKVSVITLSYNKPHLIGETIDSILGQTLQDIDLILVDNSTTSKEEVRSILRSYEKKDSRIRLFYENPTEDERKYQYVGALYTNKYMDIAEGQYLYLLADDDIILPTCLQELYDCAEATDSHCAYLGQDWVVPGEVTGTWSVWQHREYNYIYGTAAHFHCSGILGQSSVIFRKDCLSKIDKPYFPVEWETATMCDGLFLDKMAKEFKIYPLGKTLCIIRFFHGSNFSLLSQKDVVGE